MSANQPHSRDAPALDRPAIVQEIADILARGYLRQKRSLPCPRASKPSPRDRRRLTTKES